MYSNHAYISPAASEVEERNLGTPQTPARGLRPPAPLAAASEGEERNLGRSTLQQKDCIPLHPLLRRAKEREKRNLGTPQTPARGLRPPALPLVENKAEERKLGV